MQTRRPKQLVRHGDAAAGVPATRIMARISLAWAGHSGALIGLPAHYIVAQLGGWQERRAAFECRITWRISAPSKSISENIIAVAAWLSQQSLR
jgi:hypothetical protein